MLNFNKNVFKNGGRNAAPYLVIDRDGRRHIYDVLNAVYSESWSQNTLILLLTAGPVTYIGLQIGYYLGYGRLASTELVIYFAGFTIVSGLLGIGLRILDNILKARRKRKDMDHYNTVMDFLPDLIKLSQNIRLYGLEFSERQEEASLNVLKNTHAEVDAIETAVFSLTGSAVLSDGIKKIEIFRRNGLPVIVRDTARDIFEEAHTNISQVRERRPDIADQLEVRLMGKAPTLEEGLKRSEGFLERLLAWMENFNEELLRPRDFEELFTLVLELICDREIPSLSIDYNGPNRISRTATALNRARDSYRIAHGARFSRLKSLERYFRDIEDLEDQLQPAQKEATLVLDAINRQTGQLCDLINKLINELNSPWPDFERRKKITRLKKLTLYLKTVLGLYQELVKAHDTVVRYRETLKKTLAKWEDVSAGYSNPFMPLFDTLFRNCRNLTITERMIKLTDPDKIKLSRRLSGILRNYFRSYNILLTNPQFEITADKHSIAKEEMQKLAVEMLHTLEEMIEISKPENQRAIEYSNAPNYESLEIGLSKNTKIGWAMAITGEVEDDLSFMAERLFRALIAQYGVKPDDEIQNLLVETYNARKSVLNYLRENTPAGSEMPVLSAPEKMPQKPFIQRAWLQTLDRAENHLYKFSKSKKA